MIEMTIDNVLVSEVNDARVVMLKESGGDRYLPLFVGPAEANAITVRLQNIRMPRPLTHDLVKSVIESLGASVDSVMVTELEDNVYHGSMVLSRQGQQFHIDSRPSDCMALALRFGVPIYVNESVLIEAAMVIDPESGELKPHQEVPDYRSPTKEPEQPPDAFREVIEGLDLQDMDDQ